MRESSRRRIGWMGLALTVLLLVLSVGLQVAARRGPGGLSDIAGGLVFIVIGVSIGTLGALIVSRQPRNAIGWIFVGLALLVGVNALISAWVMFVYGSGAGSGRTAHIADWLANLTQGPSLFGAFVFIFLLFPTGRLLTRRWRWAAWAAAVALAFVTLAVAFRPGPMQSYSSVRNPFGVDPLATILRALESVGYVLLMLTLLAAAISLILRFRRSHGDERQQLKWFASATVFAAILILSGPLLWNLTSIGWLYPAAFALAVFSVLASIGVAMLKYRLYDIDIIINRTLVYLLLTVSLGAVYLAGVIGLQGLFRAVTGQASDVAVAISTLAIAALFQPFRRRIQSTIDQRFYRRKYDAARTLAAFQSHLRDEVDLEQLSTDLIHVVQETMQPAHASLWLRPTRE